MEKSPYALAIKRLNYAHVCTRPNIAYVIRILSRYLNIPGVDR